MKLLNLICLLLLLPTTGWAAEGSPTSDTPLQWRDGDRVVLLGDAFVERLQAHGYLESLMVAAFPQRNIQVRNLGWSGDTVTGIARALFGSPEDGFERLKRDVNAAQPTVILVAYGANEAFAGESGLPAFAAQLNHLLDALEATRARLVLLSPHRRLPPPSPLPDFAQYNRDLRDYCEVLRTAAEERHLAYVDLYDLLDAAGGDGPRPDVERLTDNGMHLSRFGYWQVAPLLAARLGIPLPRWEVTLSAEGSEVASLGTRVAELARTDQGLRCQLHDEHLSYPRFPAGDTGPSHPLAPAGKLTVTGLSPGKYHLHIDGHEIVQGDHTQWQAGIVLPRRGDEARFERLRGEIVRKNDLYFHRYRPQNETYLFLFRKHEQGNNAVEIPQFDPLIAEAEKRIAQLAKTQPRTLELRRVSH